MYLLQYPSELGPKWIKDYYTTESTKVIKHSYRIGLGFEESKYSALPRISLVNVASTEYKWTIIGLLKNLESEFCSKDSKTHLPNFHEGN